jgi:hypothetical protein
MARTPDVPGHPLTAVVKVRFSDDDMLNIEERRGSVDISVWIRNLVRREFSIDPHLHETTTANHRHRPGKELASRTVKGVTTTRYRCKTEGCTHEMERTS